MQTPGFHAEMSLRPASTARRGIEFGEITVCDCVPACRQVTICILGYCAPVTICSDCAYVRNCRIVSR